MRISADEYLAHMTFHTPKRPLLAELMGPLVGLEDEWRAQGATPDEINLTAFGFDYVEYYHPAVNLGVLGGPGETTLEENDEYILRRDNLGRRVKRFKAISTALHPLDYPVTDMDSWLKLKPLYEFSESRFSEGWAEQTRQACDRGMLIKVSLPGGFDEPRQLMGEERLCLAYFDQPELIHDILTTIGDMAERVLDRVSREVRIDQLSVHEDLAGKSGAAVGPKQIVEFIKPYYRRIWDMLSARGTLIFDQDSDGNINSVIPAFLDAGINAMHPMEPAAEMDIVKVRQTYGTRLAFKGGIDKHVIRVGKEAIRRELEYKLPPLMNQGGVVFGLDHRIPNGTPIELYRYYMRTAREILGLDPNPQPGWGRMSF